MAVPSGYSAGRFWRGVYYVGILCRRETRAFRQMPENLFCRVIFATRPGGTCRFNGRGCRNRVPTETPAGLRREIRSK